MQISADDATPIREFLDVINTQSSLGFTDEQLQAATDILEDQWFNTAGELAAVDEEAFSFLNLPQGMSEAILQAFGKQGASHVVSAPILHTNQQALAPDEIKISDLSEEKEEKEEKQEGDPNAPVDGFISPTSGRVQVEGGNADAAANEEEFKEEEEAKPEISRQPSGPSSSPIQNLQALRKAVEHVVSQGSKASQHSIKALKGMLRAGMAQKNSNKLTQTLLRELLKKLDAIPMAELAPDEFSQEEDQELKEEEGAKAEDAQDAEDAEDADLTLVSEVGVDHCSVCLKRHDTPVVLECKHAFCKSCVHDYVMKKVHSKKAVGIKCPQRGGCSESPEMCTGDLQKVLSASEFEEYLEATLMAFMEQDESVFFCPNEKCKSAISLEPRAVPEVPDTITETTDEGKVLTPEAWKHFMQYRIRCIECQTVFCADCKVNPYHKGFTCKDFATYQSARHCRYCSSQLDANNSVKNPPSSALRDVCTDEECVEKMELACTKFNKCGCPCGGVRDEKECLPCLKHDLEEDESEEYCPICYVESLAEAPCVKMQGPCKHIMHIACVKNKAAAKWPNARIGFECLNCPICKQRMEHPAMEPFSKDLLALERKIKKKALERLEYEGLAKDKEIIKKGGKFYEDPEGYAMHEFLFYMCYECNKPYFAGNYQCQEAGGAFNPAELICPGCQPNSGDVQECKKHGSEWLAYKCRYCCNIGAFHCWATTHFCHSCHKAGVWQKLAVFRTGENKKKLWEYPQCPGLAKQIKVLQKKYKSDKKLEAACEQLLCDEPENCPLKIRHPPNGMEYGLGCTMCDNKKAEKSNELAAEKAEKEKKIRDKKVDVIKEIVERGARADGSMRFKYKSDFDNNGILQFLATQGLEKSWKNPAELGFVHVTTSGLMSDSKPPSAAVGDKVVRCVTQPVRNSWFCFDLMDFSVTPSAYSIRHYSSWDNEALRHWVLEGSNDGVLWEAIRVHKDDKSLLAKGSTMTWPLDIPYKNKELKIKPRYRMFRIIQTGRNSNNNFYCAISGFELYGDLYPTFDPPPSEDLDFSGAEWKTFEHKSDFDENGICYHLGTKLGARQWKNPAESGYIKVKCSELGVQPASNPPSAVVGRELVRCCTVPKPNMWFTIDFKHNLICPTHYTLKHYSSWDLEALRNWRLDGSNDGVRWITIKEHKDDQGLDGKGSTFTWPLECNKAYCMFRLLQTGKNSNGHHYLACSGFEMYGHLRAAQAKIPKKQLRTFKYSYDFDSNGLFYWLGTRANTAQWRNPHDTGLVKVSCSALATTPPSAGLGAVVGRQAVRCVSVPKPDMWFQVDIKDMRLRPTHYTLKHYNTWDTEALRNWRLEGSIDGKLWDTLRSHENDRSLNKKGATHTWSIKSVTRAYRYFRVLQTGINSNNNYYLALSGIELYGSLVPADPNEKQYQKSSSSQLQPDAPRPFTDGMQFDYTSDFDNHGVLYWLGTKKMTTPWRNPGQLGIVEVTSSPLAPEPKSSPVWAVTGREAVRCVTLPSQESWFAIDLKQFFCKPTHYTLRHYSSWDTEAIRDWKLQGSNDGKKWSKIMSHKKDASLNRKGMSKTWVIPKTKKAFRMFRVLQTGKNSNGHWYLALSGFEIYGKLYSSAKK